MARSPVACASTRGDRARAVRKKVVLLANDLTASALRPGCLAPGVIGPPGQAPIPDSAREHRMSVPNPPPPPPPVKDEITVISHSNVFYWWPVWVLGFIFGIWTMIEGHVMVTVPQGNED